MSHLLILQYYTFLHHSIDYILTQKVFFWKMLSEASSTNIFAHVAVAVNND